MYYLFFSLLVHLALINITSSKFTITSFDVWSKLLPRLQMFSCLTNTLKWLLKTPQIQLNLYLNMLQHG